MSIASVEDWAGLRQIGRIVRLTLEALAAQVRPGITTTALDDVAKQVLLEHGARSAPALVYGFPGTVLISVNDEVVHGIPGPRRLERGDVVKLDVTLEKDGYVADAARTVIVEEGSESARRLVACAQAAFMAGPRGGAAPARAGEGERAAREEGGRAGRAGFPVTGGLPGPGAGRTIPDPPQVPNHYDPWQRDVLTEGLVLTIEPLICTGRGTAVTAKDGWTVRTKDGSLAAHHEHTLVIT